VRLREAIDRTRARLGDGTLGDPVASLEDALSALYEIEEYFVDVLGRDGYYTIRDSSLDGLALGGLMYARGLITHGQAETAHLVSRAVTRAVPRRGGMIYPGPQRVWKPLSELPLPGIAEKYGRDAYYEQYVEGRDLLAPIESSLAFLATLS
jgi:hypothetical protein